MADRYFPEHAMKYLGMQGDMWDAQKDIFFACLGAALMMTVVYIHHRFRKDKAA